MHLTEKQEVDIINAYSVDLIPMIKLASQYGITRQGIHKVLKRNEIDTQKAGKLAVSCHCCQKEMQRHRCQVRARKHLFCSMECYYAYIEASQGGKYIYSRHGQRIGRSIVSEHFDLLPGHVVHHEDRNTLNNIVENLRVFANNGDHIRHHRGFESLPIWDGSAL